MAKIKFTKSVVDATTFRAKEYELRDTAVPGFLLKVTPAGRKIFMLQYRTNTRERRKPAIGRFGELRACCEIIDSQEKNRWMPDNAGKESQIEWVVEVQAIHWNGDRLQRDSDAL